MNKIYLYVKLIVNIAIITKKLYYCGGIEFMKKLVSLLIIAAILFSFGGCNKGGKIVSVATSDTLSFIIKSNGTVEPIGLGENDTSTDGWKNIKKIAVAFNYITYEGCVAAALTNDGKVMVNYYDFSNNDGVVENTYNAEESGNFEKILECENVIDIATDGKYVYALKDNGEIVLDVCSNMYNSNSLPEYDFSDFKDIKSISAGDTFLVGLKNDGTVVSVGYSALGGTNVSDWKDITAITSVNEYTIGVKSDGTVIAAKCIINDDDHDMIKTYKQDYYNAEGELDFENWTDIKDIASSGRHTVGLKSDGTVIAVGNNDDGQCDVSEWTDIIKISACRHNTYGIKSDGTIVVAGRDLEE